MTPLMATTDYDPIDDDYRLWPQLWRLPIMTPLMTTTNYDPIDDD